MWSWIRQIALLGYMYVHLIWMIIARIQLKHKSLSCILQVKIFIKNHRIPLFNSNTILLHASTAEFLHILSSNGIFSNDLCSLGGIFNFLLNALTMSNQSNISKVLWFSYFLVQVNPHSVHWYTVPLL